MLFNREIMRDLGLESPYKYVFDGTWTMDKLTEFTKGAYRDLNGNGVKDDEDIYGYVNTSMDRYFPSSCEVKIVTVDKGGRPALSINGERYASVINKAYNLIHAPDSYAELGWFESFAHFANGKALTVFWHTGYWKELRPIEFEFGILPPPKLNEQQKNYHILLASVLGVPNNIGDPENLSMIIQAFAEKSYKYLRPAMIDNVLYNKCLQDEESQRIMDIILDSKTYDLGFTFQSDYRMFNMIMVVVTQNKSTDFVSYYEKYAEKEQGILDNVFDEIAK